MNDHHLFLGHFADGIMRTFLAQAAVLQPAIGHEIGPPLSSPVDVEISTVDLAGELQGSGNVTGEQ